jgi:transcriptional regulator with XRE-family HTH domain
MIRDIAVLIAARLKEKRKERGLTLVRVSELTGLSVSFLSDIEVGRSSPSLSTLAKLTECYQTTIAELCIEAEMQQYVTQVRIRMLEKARDEICAELERIRNSKILIDAD